MTLQDYSIDLLRRVEAFKNATQPVIIFGTRILGLLSEVVCRYYGKEILCFVDNNKDVQGREIFDIPVLSPEKASEAYRDYKVYFTFFNMNTIETVRKQCDTLGITDTEFCDVLLYLYQFEVHNRPIPKEDFIRTIHQLYIRQGEKKSFSEINIFTSRLCTLNCKHCSALVPKFKAEKAAIMPDKNVLMKSIDTVGKVHDAIHTLIILGGEPLLRKDIVDIIQAASAVPTSSCTKFVTNATILPDDSVMQALADSACYINISDYRDSRQKPIEFAQLCRKYNLACEILCDEQYSWYEQNAPQKQGRTLEGNKEVFSKCFYRYQWPSIVGSTFHICGCSGGLYELPSYQDNPSDYVDLEQPIDIVREQIEQLYQKDVLYACEYCDFGNQIPTARGVQA